MAERFAAINLKAVDAMIRDNVPHCRELGIRVVDLAPGTMTMALAYQERLIGNPETGFLHGGVITTLVDTVSGMAVLAALRKLVAIATLDLRIDYLKPATPKRELLARAECYKTTRQIAFTRCTAYHEPSDPIASCVGAFMIGSSARSAMRPPADGRGGGGAHG